MMKSVADKKRGAQGALKGRAMTRLLLSTTLLAVLLLAGARACFAGTDTPAETRVPTRGDASLRKAAIRVDFVGNRVFSSSRLGSLCVAPDESSEEELSARICQRVVEAYSAAGYLSAAVESTCVLRSDGGKKLLIYIHEGEPARLASFKFAGNKHFSSEELANSCGLRDGTALTSGSLEAALQRIVSYMADRGFPFASAKVGDLGMDGSRLTSVLVVDEGPLCTVGGVVLENSGALTTKSLERALGIRSGDEFCERDLRRGLGYLKRTALFAEVGEPLVSFSAGNASSAQGPAQSGRVTIAVPVRDRKATSIAGAVGFRGRTNEVTGGVSLSLLNIARTGRSAKASWEATGRNVSSFYLSYSEPWVVGLPFTSSVSFEQIARDTLFSRTAFGVLLKVPLGCLFSAQLGTNFEKALNTDGPGMRTSRLAWLAGVELFTGEPVWSLQNSFLASVEGTRGDKKTVYLSENVTTREAFSTLTGRVLLQRRVTRNQIALADVKGSAIMEGVRLATPDELFSLGGKRTLRGFAERQFLAPTVGSVQSEYGLAVGNEGGKAFVFLDCGYASTQALSTMDRFHAGYGIGLRVPSPIGLAGIDFGVPWGESLGSGKIHVALEGTF